jgi:hypothetical protein
MPPRIYADTSVFGGCEDAEFQAASIRIMSSFVRGESKLVISNVTVDELEGAPERVREFLRAIPDAHVETITTNKAVEVLADSYIEHRAVSLAMRADALHIALATIARVDVLVSWNFKHIVNLNRIKAYNGVNVAEGYPEIEIRTPSEVIAP